MANTTLTREEFKALAKEMLKNDKTLFLEIIKEMEEEENREQKVEKMIKNDFERYREVFKALA